MSETIKQTGYPSKLRLHEKDATFFQKHPVIPGCSIFSLIKYTSRKYRKEIAIEDVGKKISFERLIENAQILARSLYHIGLQKGDILTMVVPNCYQGIELFLAANSIGVIVTFLNSHATVQEVERYLKMYGSSVLVKKKYTEEDKKILCGEGNTRCIITLEQMPSQHAENAVISYESLLNRKSKGIQRSIGIKNCEAMILYTSGTTGNPKSVVLTNKNIIATAIYLKNSSHVTQQSGEKSMVCVSFCYPYGFVTSVLMSLLCGRTVIIGPDISKDTIADFYMQSPNIIFGSPALLELTMRNIPDNMDLSSVETFISGGDFLNEQMAKRAICFFREHNCKEVEIINGSGNAETCGGNTNAYGCNVPFLSVGKPFYGVSAIVVNENMEELPYEQEGMFCISGKNVFKEYYGNPELTRQSKFRYQGKEYFKTGTNGRLLLDGSFELTGRSSRFYIISTLNKVYCDHAQMALNTIEGIESAAVVKHPDSKWLYVGHAFIILNDKTMTSERIIKELQKERKTFNGEVIQLKEYEIPKYFTVVEKFPRTKADKIDYMELEKESLSIYGE